MAKTKSKLKEWKGGQSIDGKPATVHIVAANKTKAREALNGVIPTYMGSLDFDSLFATTKEPVFLKSGESVWAVFHQKGKSTKTTTSSKRKMVRLV